MVETAALRTGAARLNLAREAMHWVVEAIVGARGRAHETRPAVSYRVLPATTATTATELRKKQGSQRPAIDGLVFQARNSFFSGSTAIVTTARQNDPC